MMAAAPPPDWGRLGTISPAEISHYEGLYASLGCDPASGGPAPSGAIVDALKQSGLPQEALRHIWELAAAGGGSLDFPGFCAACRLVAHAQQLGLGAISAAAVAETPSSPPYFGGDAGHPAGAAGGGHDVVAASPEVQDFDFEASAFGVGPSAPMGPPSGPPAPAPAASSRSLVGSVGALPAASLGTAGALHSFEGTATGRGLVRSSAVAADDPGLGSAALVAAALEPGGGPAALRHAATERLGRELVERRRELDKSLASKGRLEQQLEKARGRLEAVQEERRSVVIELSTRQADVQRLFAELDFLRERIEDTQVVVSSLRGAREAFGHEDLARVAQRYGSFEHRAPEAARAAAEALRGGAAQNGGAGAAARDRAGRLGRQRSDLHARQQILFSGQQQAERERMQARQDLERLRADLGAVQEQRLAAQERRFEAVDEAMGVARDLGLGPGVIAELLGRPQQAPSAADVAASRKALSRGLPAQRPAGAPAPVSPLAEELRALGQEEDAGDVAVWWRAKLGATGGGAPLGPAPAPGGQPPHWANFGDAAAPQDAFAPPARPQPCANSGRPVQHPGDVKTPGVATTTRTRRYLC